jgi:hypothetical protein
VLYKIRAELRIEVFCWNEFDLRHMPKYRHQSHRHYMQQPFDIEQKAQTKVPRAQTKKSIPKAK